ncbi:MAG: hypothetical protein IK063_05180, partial [Clostridia bacterium]|nr:hypothetical protein [Clostridia bacterium]
KSGKVKIEVKMKNNLCRKYKIEGEERDIYLPVLVVGGFVMPEAEFSGVQVTNGRAIGDGTKEIAVMFGVPGLAESLGLKEAGLDEIPGISLGSTASVTTEAENLALGNMYFAAIPISSLNLELASDSSVDDLKSILSVLGEVQNTIGRMDVDKLAQLLNSGESTQSLLGIMGDAVDLYNSNKALINVLAKYAAPENSEQMKKLLSFMTDSNTAKAISLLSDSSVAQFFAGLSDLGGALPVADSFLKDLQDPEVRKAIDNLPQTLEKIAELQKVLNENSETIDYLMSFFNEDTVSAVSEIVSMFDEADFERIQEKYGTLAESAGEIAGRAEKWIEFGKEYRIFTSAPDDMTTSVFFVYMTPSIEKEQEKKQTTTQASGESPLDEFIQKFK